MSEDYDLPPIEARAFYRIYSDDVAVFLMANDPQGNQRHVGRAITWQEAERGSFNPDPTFRLSLNAAQTLMGSLWDAGIRPAQAKFGDGQAKHLEDMRAIAFAKLNVAKP